MDKYEENRKKAPASRSPYYLVTLSFRIRGFTKLYTFNIVGIVLIVNEYS